MWIPCPLRAVPRRLRRSANVGRHDKALLALVQTVSRECRSVQVVAQHLRAARVAQLRHRLRLDLADAFTGHAVNLADLVEGAGLAVGEAEAQPYDAGLAVRQWLSAPLPL